MKDQLDLVAALVLENGQQWGEVATQWQWDNMKAMLSGDHQYLFLTRPRGGSKTSDVAAASIAMLIEQLPARGRAYCFAASRDQAAILFDAMVGFITRTPELRARLDIQNLKIINRDTAATLAVMSADGAGAYGLRAHWLVIDEFAIWPDTPNSEQLWLAIFTAVPKITGCRLIIISNAGHPMSLAGQVITSAKESDNWFVSEIPGPLPWIDPQQLEEQKRLLNPTDYDRWHLNFWTIHQESFATFEQIQALVTNPGPTDPQPGIRYVLTLDIGTTNDATVLTVSHKEQDVVHIDQIDRWTGTKQNPVVLDHVVQHTLAMSRRLNRAPLVYDPHQAAGPTQTLARQGVDVTPHYFSQDSNHQIALSLQQHIRTDNLALYPHDELLEELATVRMVENDKRPNIYRIDHLINRHDDIVVTVAMACLYWDTQPEARAHDPRLGQALSWANADFIKPRINWSHGSVTTIGSGWNPDR